MLDDSQLQELREKHGDVRDIVFITDEDEEVQIVLRRPRADRTDSKKDEFFSFWTRRAAIEQTPRGGHDPSADGTTEMLRCLVCPDQMTVHKHLQKYPGDKDDLRAMFRGLAGEGSVADAPELITEQVKESFHKRAFAMKVAGRPIIARPMTAPEHAKFLQLNGGTILPMRSEALAWAAWCCSSEMPDEAKAKPLTEAIFAECPMAAIVLGISLLGAAKSRVKAREKKSVTPSAPPPPNIEAESSEPAADSYMPSQAGPEVPGGAPELST